MIHKVVKERFSGRMVSETVEGTMRLRMHKKKDDFGTFAYLFCPLMTFTVKMQL